jgi:hypothetical protein
MDVNVVGVNPGIQLGLYGMKPQKAERIPTGLVHIDMRVSRGY